jgi:GNAT superfamily N-acetyltransferase
MHIRSLALATELELAALRGRVLDRGDYVVVSTPDDPTYYDGNYLALPAAPQVGEVAYWTRRFGEELGHDPEVRHVALRWDGTAGDVGARDELVAAGFTIDVHQALTATAVRPHATALPIRPLAPADLTRTAELAFAIGDNHSEGFRQFLARRAAWHRDLVERGLATFWGAFDGDALVGSLGLVPLRVGSALPLDQVARYQDVQVLPSHRGRGLASALLGTSAAHAVAAGIPRLVIVAESDSPASRVYQRAGFTIAEHVASAWRHPV